MNDVRNVLKRFPKPYKSTVSARCNVEETAIEQWEKRGKVPAKHWPELVNWAKELKLVDITYEFLAKISQGKQSP